MLIGKFPFDCDTDMQLLWQVLKGIKFPDRPVLSANAKDLIRSLTEPQPSQRATLQAILEHVWMQAAIKADPNFEKDEEEAVLMAQRSRSQRNSDGGAGSGGGSVGGDSGATTVDSANADNSSSNNNNDDDDDDDDDDNRDAKARATAAATVEPAAPATQRAVDPLLNGI
jgi:serine/threonine protein kinase